MAFKVNYDLKFLLLDDMAFKYNNRDLSILMDILATENVADRKNHDLLSLNTDYEYQEESFIISQHKIF